MCEITDTVSTCWLFMQVSDSEHVVRHAARLGVGGPCHGATSMWGRYSHVHVHISSAACSAPSRHARQIVSLQLAVAFRLVIFYSSTGVTTKPGLWTGPWTGLWTGLDYGLAH